jgi:hypothetical protein
VGEKFVAEERGAPEVKAKKGSKTAAIKLAQEQLSPERLASATPEETFAVAKKLLGFTTPEGGRPGRVRGDAGRVAAR